MSLPTIPNIPPDIPLTQCDAINLLLSSIALEEIGLSRILNAEGEKLQQFLKNSPQESNDYLDISRSVNAMLRTIVKSQILLHFKLEDTMLLAQQTCWGNCGVLPPSNPCHIDKKCKPGCTHKKENAACCKHCED